MNDQNSGVTMNIHGLFELFILWICGFEDLPYSDWSTVDLDAGVLTSLETIVSMLFTKEHGSHTRYNAVAPFSSV